MTTRLPIGVFFALFTVSGFAGLIYQSIWSHYLKLFLGHAAYAQTLVLAIFMGGMAIGSWVVSRYTDRIRSLLLGYALAELGIGLLAIVFHGVFKTVTGWAFDSVLPGLGSPAAVDAFKWLVASVLILPASVLLGTTFPLMSAGIIRAWPEHSARVLAMLYFTNSLGASIGVLASGFWLIDLVGLPGTMLSAGILNVTLAIFVWALLKRADGLDSAPAPAPAAAAGLARPTRLYGFVLLAVAVTGAASFIYEITWVRMLSMGLGASSHAFEVMLSAFILGMALGGLLLRSSEASRRGDLGWLAGTFIAKGAFAALAIGAYPWALEFVAWTMKAVARSDEGYTLFNISSHVASMMVMLPAAVCAGMTLPIATNALVVRGLGESSIGRVYAANTAGCIVGAAFATHVGMEWLGVKGLTALGALADVGLGLAIVVAFLGIARQRAVALALVSVGFLAVAFPAFELDKRKMSSAVYRYGSFLSPETEGKYYRDGKTATISAVQVGTTLTIRTNGKPDAGVEMENPRRISSDEPTMVLAGVLPMAYRPNAKTYANIGLGSGLTTHSVLANPRVERVDTIEIERAVIEGARLFGKKNERAYTDPRSRFHIDDAKTFFASHNSQYDVIISEPSNPWVSGVATLFSEEFYAHVRRYLKDDGLLVQWIQIYEIDFELVASILKALGAHFGDYTIYTTNEKDLLILATKGPRMTEPTAEALSQPAVAAAMAAAGIHGMPDLEALRVGSRRVLEPLVQSGRVPANSDYFPVVDSQAPRLRFRNASAQDITLLSRSPVSLVSLAGPDRRYAPADLQGDHPVQGFRRDRALRSAEWAAIFLDGRHEGRSRIGDVDYLAIAALRQGLEDCSPSPRFWLSLVRRLVDATAPFMDAATMARIGQKLTSSKCHGRLSPGEREELAFWIAVATRDTGRLAELGPALLARADGMPPSVRMETAEATIGALLIRGDAKRAREIHLAHRDHFPAGAGEFLTWRLLGGHLGAGRKADAGAPDASRHGEGAAPVGAPDK